MVQVFPVITSTQFFQHHFETFKSEKIEKRHSILTDHAKNSYSILRVDRRYFIIRREIMIFGELVTNTDMAIY